MVIDIDFKPVERMMLSYYNLLITLYNRASEQLASGVEIHESENPVAGYLHKVTAIDEPAYHTLIHLVALMRIDPEEKRHFFELIDQAHFGVYITEYVKKLVKYDGEEKREVDLYVILLCADVDRETCIREYEEGKCSMIKEVGCLMGYLAEDGISYARGRNTISYARSLVRKRRLTKVMMLIGERLTDLLKEMEVMVFQQRRIGSE